MSTSTPFPPGISGELVGVLFSAFVFFGKGTCYSLCLNKDGKIGGTGEIVTFKASMEMTSLRDERIHLQLRRRKFDPWVGKIPWRRKWQHTPVFLLGNPMDRGNWEGYGPQGRRVSHD